MSPEEWRARVERITFWFRRSVESPRLVEDPAKELFPFAEIRFANRKCRYDVLTKGVITPEWTAGQDDHSVQILRKHYWKVVGQSVPKIYSPNQAEIRQEHGILRGTAPLQARLERV